MCEDAWQLISIRPDSAFVLANECLKQSRAIQYKRGIAESHEIIGEVFFHQGFYQESLDHLQDAAALYRELPDNEKLARNLNMEGLVYHNIKQAELGFHKHEEALSIYKTLGDKQGMAYSFGCMGHFYEKKQHYDKALSFQQQALQFYEEINDRQGIATILENIGSIFEDLEQYNKALQYFRRSLKLNELTRDSVSMIVNLNNIGDNYRKTGNYDSALIWTEKSLQVALRLHNRYQVSSAYKDLSKTYALAGKFEEAYKHLEKGRTLYEEIYDQDAQSQLKIFTTLFDIERKNNEIKLLESDQKVSRIIKSALASGLVLSTMLGMLIINRQRMKIRQNKTVISQNQEVYEAQKKLMQIELENAQLREQKLQQDLDVRSKSLTAHTLHIMSKNKMMEDIQQRLSDILKEDTPELRKKIKNLLKMIDSNFVQDKDWEDFRHVFEQVHQDFFHKLQQQGSDLTPAEVRLASLIRLNLSSKDMAVILGISSDSLRIARYRLRKKLQLQQEQSLTQYILSL
jgi:tetratricopeptide (TPR) repeat protein